MKTADLIPAIEFCRHYNIDLSFIQSLNESGLLEITILEEKLFVPESQLLQLEKMVRLYYEMNINLEGIETISYLLQRMSDLQQQVILLTNRLSQYED
jgi:chaperone modulatory protein CbpM